MHVRLRIALLAALAVPTGVALSETYLWLDDEGVTHVTDDPAAAPDGVEPIGDRAALGEVWTDVVGSQAGPPIRSTSLGDDRIRRQLRGAVDDLRRGENARAVATLQSVLRDEPGQPEAHWYLALLARQRGRFEAAEQHLRAFLASAGDRLDPWRASARRRLQALEDERRLADEHAARGPAEWVAVSSPNFRVSYDSELGRAQPGYAQRVIRYLEEARASTAVWLGAAPAEPMGVVFYGKATYLRAHGHRFSFQTVGFFDGRIHVVSAAHPAGELRSLLFHEYVHAVFREQTGGDRPYWLNEGLSELAERASRRQPGLTRGERMALRARIEDGAWIPLSRLAPSFAGLSDGDARAAYLESTAAVAWIERHSDRRARARLLASLGSGASSDEALRAAVGLDTAGLEAEVQQDVLSEFPARPVGD